MSQKIGLYLLARYPREAGPESPRDRLRAVLLDLHARQTHYAQPGTRPADRDRAMMELGHLHTLMSRADESRAKT